MVNVVFFVFITDIWILMSFTLFSFKLGMAKMLDRAVSRAILETILVEGTVFQRWENRDMKTIFELIIGIVGPNLYREVP